MKQKKYRSEGEKINEALRQGSRQQTSEGEKKRNGMKTRKEWEKKFMDRKKLL